MKRIWSRLGSATAVLILAVGLIPAQPALAATSPAAEGPFNVTLSPASQDLEVKPGGSVTALVQVRNNGLTTEHIKASILKFTSTGKNGTPQLLTPTASDDFIQWAKLPQPTFDAEPGVWQTFRMNITPPKTAAFGYYYAINFTRNEPIPTGSKGQALVASAVSFVLLDVQAPGAVRKASLAEFSTPNKFMEFLPANFTVRMHNDGNVHVAARGNIFISKGGKNIGLVEVNLGQGSILPGSNRAYPAQWKDGTPSYVTKVVSPGQSRTGVTTHLSWNGFSLSKLRFGKYHARLVMVYNNGTNDVADQASLDFWVIPWRILAVGLVILLLVLAGLWLTILSPLRRSMRANRRRGHGRFR